MHWIDEQFHFGFGISVGSWWKWTNMYVTVMLRDSRYFFNSWHLCSTIRINHQSATTIISTETWTSRNRKEIILNRIQIMKHLEQEPSLCGAVGEYSMAIVAENAFWKMHFLLNNLTYIWSEWKWKILKLEWSTLHTAYCLLLTVLTHTHTYKKGI